MSEVKIKHPTTGEVRVYDDDGYANVVDKKGMKPPYTLADALFMYTEHNYACDCNRRRFFERAGGEAETEGDDRCCFGEPSFKIELWCEGRCFHSEFE